MSRAANVRRLIIASRIGRASALTGVVLGLAAAQMVGTTSRHKVPYVLAAGMAATAIAIGAAIYFYAKERS